jgi:hypothetical protein
MSDVESLEERHQRASDAYHAEQKAKALEAGKEWGTKAPPEQYNRLRNLFVGASDQWDGRFLNDKNPLATFFVNVVNPSSDKMNPVGADSFWAENCVVASTAKHVQSFADGALAANDARHDSIR